MKMVIKNPNHVKRYGTAAQRADLLGYLSANAAKASIDFDELRAKVPALAALKDGQLHQMAIDEGLTVSADE